MDQQRRGRRRPKITLAEQRRWVEHFEQSGRSQTTFAQKHGLNVFTLRKWLRDHPAAVPELAPTRPSSSPLREVPLSQVWGPRWAAEVVWPGETMVRLSAEVPPAMLERLLRALPC